MSWRSPFQTTRGAGVPFPALTPWANSPGQPSDSGSPMQTTPMAMAKSVMRRGTKSMQTSSFSQGSPMDAAPYTPLSARRGVSVQAPDNTAKFVGKLSFTPHISHRRQHGISPASKQPPVVGPDQRAAGGNKSPVQPPLTSMYASCTDSNATDHSGMAQQSANSGKEHTCCLRWNKLPPRLQADNHPAMPAGLQEQLPHNALV